MPCDLREMLQRQFYFFGTYFLEEDILSCWTKAARRARIVFDIGANAGIYSLAALAQKPDADVHAFEPTAEIAARLRETASLNRLDRLHTHELAVSRENGHAILHRWRGADNSNEGMNFITMDGDDAAERVQTVCLDGFCRNQSIEHIDLLKLDIQGQEAAALAGAKGLLNAGAISTIFMELNWTPAPAVYCPATDAIETLQRAGYHFSKPGLNLIWRPAGGWLRNLSDIVAQRLRPTNGMLP